MRRGTADPQGTRDAASLLPVAAAILLLPPVIVVFAAPVLIAGIPLIVVYVFGVWAAFFPSRARSPLTRRDRLPAAAVRCTRSGADRRTPIFSDSRVNTRASPVILGPADAVM